MGYLRDLFRHDKESRDYGLPKNFDTLPVKTSPVEIPAPAIIAVDPPVEIVVEPSVEPPAAFDLSAPEEIEAPRYWTDYPEEFEIEIPESTPPAAPTEEVEDKLIESTKGAGFEIRIFQIGEEYRGEVSFASRHKLETLHGDSLSHLRGSLINLAAQGITQADLQADSREEIPSNSNPSFGFRNEQ